MDIDFDRAIWFIYESNLIEKFDAVSRSEIRFQFEQKTRPSHAAAFLYFSEIARLGEPLSRSDLFVAHKQIMREYLSATIDGYDGQDDCDGQIGGWRKTDFRFTWADPPRWPRVPEAMEKFLARLAIFVSGSHGEEEVIDFAADAHHEFIRTHPFIDGNGRVGRLIANYVLRRFGLPIAVFTAQDSARSYFFATAHETPVIMREYLHAKIRTPYVPLSVEQYTQWRFLSDEG